MTPIVPLGDRAFLARFDSEEEASRWALGVIAAVLPGVVDVVAAYKTVGVHADPERVDLESLAARLQRVTPAEANDLPANVIRIPVLYDGEDLPEVAAQLRLGIDEVIAAHCGHEYHVFAIGFQPGFPYAGYLPEELSGLARRASPRTRVPAGSVAIVGRQTAVYPASTPGGWHLIGRTPARIVDVESAYFPIRAGDRLRFEPIDRDEFEARRGERL